MQILRFAIVGLINTGVSYGVYALGLALSLHYAAANFLAIFVGILFGFKTQGRLVFGNSDPRRIFRFVACWGALYLVNIALIGGLIRLDIDAFTAGALALVPISALSYVLQRSFVFRKTSRTDNDTPPSEPAQEAVQ